MYALLAGFLCIKTSAGDFWEFIEIVFHFFVRHLLGKMKIIKERGSAGHKGVESIIENIGNDGLIRFRIGISSENKIEAMKIVLKNFSAEEQKIIEKIIEKIVDALNSFVSDGLEKTMNKFNG